MTLGSKTTRQLLNDDTLAKDLGPILDELRKDYEKAAGRGRRYSEAMAAAFADDARFQFNDVETPSILARAAAAEMHAIDRALRTWVHLRDRIPNGAISDLPQAGDMWTTSYAVDMAAWADSPVQNASVLKEMHDRLDWLAGLDL